MSLTTYSHEPESGKDPQSVVFMLHGLGANGMDLIGIAGEWAPFMPDTLFLSPDAPFPCDLAPMGFQWFSLRDWSPQSILAGLKEAAPILNNYINQTIQEIGIKENKIVLMGFSQGTMLSLYAGPRRGGKIAGILGYSGALVGGEGLSDPQINKPPIHLIHGAADMVVPVDSYYHANQTLSDLGFPVTGSVREGLPHAIDQAGLDSGLDFLKRVLAA